MVEVYRRKYRRYPYLPHVGLHVFSHTNAWKTDFVLNFQQLSDWHSLYYFILDLNGFKLTWNWLNTLDLVPNSNMFILQSVFRAFVPLNNGQSVYWYLYRIDECIFHHLTYGSVHTLRLQYIIINYCKTS